MKKRANWYLVPEAGMSLSKYYKNSDSFQPEALIKREEKSPSGWQPFQPKKDLPFQSVSLPTVSAQKEAPLPTTEEPPKPADKLPAAKCAKAPESPQEETKLESLPKQPEIDLSNYLELVEAEKRIEEAYQKGIRIGKEKVEQDYGNATKALLDACQQLDTIRETIISNSGEELQNIALAIAERILRISIREQDSTIVATIEEALQRAVRSEEFTVYLHPEDYDTVSAHSEEIVAGVTGLNKIVIKKDLTIERGGTRIESENCTLDATITSQFDVIREEIKKNL